MNNYCHVSGKAGMTGADRSGSCVTLCSARNTTMAAGKMGHSRSPHNIFPSCDISSQLSLSVVSFFFIHPHLKFFLCMSLPSLYPPP